MAVQATAQSTVSGKVTSSTDQSPLPGVSVVIKGTTIGTITDLNGDYTIARTERAQDTLVFSFVGFVSQTVPVGNRAVVDISLSEDVRQLGEVVVTAFGIEREKRALSYAVQEVSGQQVAEAGTPNLNNALQGKVAGVLIRQSSGLPGSSSQITIRGSNSLTGNNQPLYVVDGLPIESNSPAASGIAPGVGEVSGADQTNRALDINPEDIESINVLKGPAAAALYGIRASNGVIVITTKRGKGGVKGQPRVTFSSTLMADQVSRTPDLQNTYHQGAGFNVNQGTSLSWGPRIDGLAPYVRNVSGLPRDTVNPAKFDNVSPFFRTGYTLTNDLNVSGTGDLGNWSFGVGNATQEGIVPTTDMNRITARFGGDFKVGDRVNIGATANVSDLKVGKIPGGSNLSNPLFTTYFAPISYDLWGLPFSPEGEPFRQIHYRGAMDNPRWALENNSFEEQTRRIFGNSYLSYQATSWLSFNYRIGIDNFTTDGKEVYSLGSGRTGGRTAVPSGGQITDFALRQNQINSNANAILDLDLTPDLNLNLLVGNEVYDIRTRRLTMQGNGITVGGFNNIGVTSSQLTQETEDRLRVAGFFGNMSLGFRDMLFLTASGRNDFVSNMPSGNRSFFYPSVGLTWVFTETFPVAPSVLSFGKIRGSYAQVGQSAPDPYSTRNVFIAGGAGSGFLTDGIEFPFNGLSARTLSDVIRSEDLRPQNTSTFEVGAELRFFGNRIGIDYTYYTIDVTDQIFAVPVASSTGFTSELRNAGEVQTRGHELALLSTPIQAGNFSWDFNVNLTQFRNEVIRLEEGVDNIFLGGFVVPNVRAQAGSLYPVIFGQRFARDAQGRVVMDSRATIDGAVNPYYGMPLEDPVAGAIGNVNPDFEFGFINTFRYKTLSLTAQIDWRQGGNMYAGNTRLSKLYGMDAVTEDREAPVIVSGSKGFYDGDGNLVVQGENDITIVPGQDFWFQQMDAIDESNVYETTFVRFRELVFTYQLPQSLLGSGPVKAASVFLTGRNLFLLTKYPNFDPETSTGGAANFQGLEYVALPQIRSFGGGFRVTF